jgi:MarR family transcriptional regulator for hemolysin
MLDGLRRPQETPIGLTLARTAKTVGRAFDDSLAASGGSLPIWLILISLKTHDFANQRELAKAVGIQDATLTHHLNAMEKDGLITRRRDPENRRIHQVEMTPAGETVFRRLATAAQAHDRRLRAAFDEHELTTLVGLLHRLEDSVGSAATPVKPR